MNDSIIVKEFKGMDELGKEVEGRSGSDSFLLLHAFIKVSTFNYLHYEYYQVQFFVQFVQVNHIWVVSQQGQYYCLLFDRRCLLRSYFFFVKDFRSVEIAVHNVLHFMNFGEITLQNLIKKL